MGENPCQSGSKMDYVKARFFKTISLPDIEKIDEKERDAFMLEVVDEFLMNGGAKELFDFAWLCSNELRSEVVKTWELNKKFRSWCDLDRDIVNLWCDDLGDLCYDLIFKRTIDQDLILDFFKGEEYVDFELHIENEYFRRYVENTELESLASYLCECAYYWTEKECAKYLNLVKRNYIAGYKDDVCKRYDSGFITEKEKILGLCKVADFIKEHDDKLEKLFPDTMGIEYVDILEGKYLCGGWKAENIKAAKNIEKLLREFPDVSSTQGLGQLLETTIADIIQMRKQLSLV